MTDRKNYTNFINKSDDVCYVSEEGTSYNYSDILHLCGGNVAKAKLCFDLCEWQLVETIVSETTDEEWGI